MRHNSKRYGYILASEINFTQACENKMYTRSRCGLHVAINFYMCKMLSELSVKCNSMGLC